MVRLSEFRDLSNRITEKEWLEKARNDPNLFP